MKREISVLNSVSGEERVLHHLIGNSELIFLLKTCSNNICARNGIIDHYDH
jgi:hypothetical protein